MKLSLAYSQSPSFLELQGSWPSSVPLTHKCYTHHLVECDQITMNVIIMWQNCNGHDNHVAKL